MRMSVDASEHNSSADVRDESELDSYSALRLSS